MASTPTLKQEWIDATQHLRSKDRAEVLGAICLFLLSGEKVSVSTNKGNTTLQTLWPSIEKSDAKTKTYRANVAKRWNATKRNNCKEVVSDLYDTNNDTDNDTNPAEIASIHHCGADSQCEKNENLLRKNEENLDGKLEKRETFSSPSPCTPSLFYTREESIFNNNKTLPGRDKSSFKSTGSYDLSFIESEEMREVVSDWLGYKRRRKESYKTPESLRQMVKKLTTLSQGDPGVAREIINDAIANNYAGFFALKNNNKQYGNNDYRQRLGLGGGTDAGYVPDYSESSIAVPRH